MRKATAQQIQRASEPEKYEKYATIAAGKLDLNNLDLEERAFLGTCQDLIAMSAVAQLRSRRSS